MNPGMRRFLLLVLLVVPSLLQAAQSARLTAYWVKPEQVEAAADMTADDCRQKLTVLWTESVELNLNTSAKIAHEDIEDLSALSSEELETLLALKEKMRKK